MKLLIIEDDQIVSHAVREIVSKFSDDVRQASTLSKGMAVARDLELDVVVLDLRLPDSSAENSLLVIRALKYINPKCAVVVMTGSNIDRETAIKYGADGFIGKPPMSWQDIVPEILSAVRNTGREDYDVFVRLLSKVSTADNERST